MPINSAGILMYRRIGEGIEVLLEIDEFVQRDEIDPRYIIRPYYLRPDGKVGHAFAVIRETIREMKKVAIGRVVLTNREHIIALEALAKGLIGTLLRYP
jgi:DNA end-binding protein Ku